MATKEQTILLASVGLIVAAVVVGSLVYYSLTLRGSGTIKSIGLEIYSDPGYTQIATIADFGVVDAGNSSALVLYFKSTSTFPSNWTLSTNNWIPAIAADFLSLTWDYSGEIIAPGETQTIILTLHADENIINVTNFFFEILVTAQG